MSFGADVVAASHRWLTHLADDVDDGQDAISGHLANIRPRWISGLVRHIDFGGEVGQVAAHQVAAAILGISVPSVYRLAAATVDLKTLQEQLAHLTRLAELERLTAPPVSASAE